MSASTTSILSLPSEVFLAIFELVTLQKADLKNIRLAHRNFKAVAGSILFSTLRISFTRTKFQRSEAIPLPKLNNLIAGLGDDPTATCHIPQTLRQLSISLPDQQTAGFADFITKAAGSSSFFFYFDHIQHLRLNIRMSCFADLPNNAKPTRLEVINFLSVILAREHIIGSIELRCNWKWLNHFQPSRLCSLMISHDVCENNRSVPKGDPVSVLADVLRKSESLERLEIWAPRTWPREPITHQLQGEEVLLKILTPTACNKLKYLVVSSQQIPTDPLVVANLRSLEELEIREPFSTSNLEQHYHEKHTIFWPMFKRPLRRLRISVLSHALLEYLVAKGQYLEKFDLWCNDILADIDGTTYEFRYHDQEDVRSHVEAIAQRFRNEILPVLKSLTHLSLPISIRRHIISHTEEHTFLRSYLIDEPDLQAVPGMNFNGMMQLISVLPKLSHFNIDIEGTTLIKGCACLEHPMPDLKDGLEAVKSWFFSNTLPLWKEGLVLTMAWKLQGHNSIDNDPSHVKTEFVLKMEDETWRFEIVREYREGDKYADDMANGLRTSLGDYGGDIVRNDGIRCEEWTGKSYI